MGLSFATSRNDIELTAQIQAASTLSALAHYHVMVDYNKTDVALPVCKIIADENPS
jgi:hypothetical protein